MSTQQLTAFLPTIIEKDGVAVTTSIDIASGFGKLHKNVLRDIGSLGCSEEFSRLNFEPGSYLDAQGQERPMCEITKDGFAILAMGFSGKKAMRFKEAYIAGFNRMEALLRNDSKYMAILEENQRLHLELETRLRQDLDDARRVGPKGGSRTPKNKAPVDAAELKQMQGMRATGMSYKAIGKELKRSDGTVWYLLNPKGGAA